MRFNYSFNNICGATYKGGNVLFSPDGNTLYSPIGNRVMCFDLVNHTSNTLPCESARNIIKMALSPNGSILIAVDEAYSAIIINVHRKVVIGSTQFRDKIRALEFSPDGRFIAVSQGKQTQVWRTPALITQFRPLVLHRVYTGHFDDVTCLAWSPDSLFFLTGSKDNTSRLYSLHSLPGFVPLTFSGHKTKVVGVYFGQATTSVLNDAIESRPGSMIYTISYDGSVFTWKWRERQAPDAIQILESIRLQQSILNTKRERGGDNDDDDDDDDDDASDGDHNDSDLDDHERQQVDDNDQLQLAQRRQAHLMARNKSSQVDMERQVVETDKSKTSTLRKRNLLGYDNPQELWEMLPFIARGVYSINKRNYPNQHQADSHQRGVGGVLCTALYGTTLARKAFSSGPSSSLLDSGPFGQDDSGSPQGNLLVIGYTNGTFSLYQLPDFKLIHSLSVSASQIDTVSINATGDWLAIGCATVGQLMVWEWQSESYILKQQSHLSDINTIAYSPDGQIIATGGDDGKVKLWNATTGFCFVTFSDHTGPVQHVEFTTAGTVVLSAGADGTIRAYDLIRYRNFRTLVSPTPVQFTTMTIDPSGEIVVAGGMDPFTIFVWSLQTGKLVDEFSGHTGPISSLVFSNAQSLLVSGSWDGTIRVWDIYTGKGCVESFKHSSDVIALAMRHDGRELISSCIDGNLYVWDMYELQQKNQINARNFMLTGRSAGQATTAATSHNKKLLTTLCYSPDGTCIIAGGESRYAIIFHVARAVLIKRFPLSNNLSLDAMLAKLNSKQMTSDGTLRDGPRDDDDELRIGERRALDKFLPGAQGIDFGKRMARPAIRAKSVRFSPTGFQWAACTPEGLLVYCLDQSSPFDPLEMDLDVTPEAAIRCILEEQHYGKALIMALSLNQRHLIEFTILSTPHLDISMIIKTLPQHRIPRLLEALATLLSTSSHIQLILLWVHTTLAIHARHVVLSQLSTGLLGIKLLAACRAIKKALQTKFADLSTNILSNIHTLQYTTTFDQHITTAELQTLSHSHHLAMEQDLAQKAVQIFDHIEQSSRDRMGDDELYDLALGVDQLDRKMQRFEEDMEQIEEALNDESEADGGDDLIDNGSGFGASTKKRPRQEESADSGSESDLGEDMMKDHHQQIKIENKAKPKPKTTNLRL